MSKNTKKILVIAASCTILLLILTAAGCEDGGTSQPTSTDPKTAASKYCDPNHSLACKMIIWRYEQLSNPNQYGYFYGMVQGIDHPIVMYVVQGSVFPVDDTTTPPDYQEPCNSGGSGACSVVRQAQQADGTWGTNGQGMFGELADGQYFEWLGPYAFSFQPLPFLNVKVVGCPPNKHIPGC